jgi:hypothetical protein
MSVWRTNRFWSMSLEHTLFLDFLKLFVNMRPVVSFAGEKKTHFLDLRIKSYGCLKFQGEVWAGRACAAANEKELTTLKKFWGQGGWVVGGKGQGVKIEGTRAGAVADRWSGAVDHTLTRGRRPLSVVGRAAAGRHLHKQCGGFKINKFGILNFYFF